MTIRSNATECQALIGSVTQAMKAQEALSKAAIPSRVIKSEASSSRRGCIFGIRYSCAQEGNVKTILGHAHIPVKAWTSEE